MGRNSNLAPDPVGQTIEEYYLAELKKTRQRDISPIQQALQVEGWMDVDELLYLASEAKTHFRIVEVGSFLGRSTRALADNTPGWVAAVDDWWGPREVDIPNRHLFFPQFKSNTQDLIDRGKIKVFKCDHAMAPEGLRPDMVFIDGDHSYMATLSDIRFWKSEMPKGGLICGHDVDLLAVQQAVMDTLGILDVVPETKIWRFTF